MNFELKSFSSTLSKPAHMATMGILQWLLLVGYEYLSPREVHFLQCKFHVEITNGIQNEFLTQKFQLNSL
jgi:hypothetical protein